MIDDNLIDKMISESLSKDNFNLTKDAILEQIVIIISTGSIEQQREKLLQLRKSFKDYISADLKSKTEKEILYYTINNIFGIDDKEGKLISQVNKQMAFEGYLKCLCNNKIYEIGKILNDQFQLIMNCF